MPKLMSFDEDARRKLEAGMNQLADAVRVVCRSSEPSRS